MYGTEYLPTCMVDFYGFHVGTVHIISPMGILWTHSQTFQKKVRFFGEKKHLDPRRSFFFRSEAGMGGGSSNAATAFFGWEISGGNFEGFEQWKKGPWVGWVVI